MNGFTGAYSGKACNNLAESIVFCSHMHCFGGWFEKQRPTAHSIPTGRPNRIQKARSDDREQPGWIRVQFRRQNNHDCALISAKPSYAARKCMFIGIETKSCTQRNAVVRIAGARYLGFFSNARLVSSSHRRSFSPLVLELWRGDTARRTDAPTNKKNSGVSPRPRSKKYGD